LRHGVAAVALTRAQVATLVEALLIVIDDRLDRGEINAAEWTRLAGLLITKAPVWLRDADDVGTFGYP
jgi:hypothetical protein